MKLLDTFKSLFDTSGEDRESKEIVKTFQKDHYKWMDYLDPNTIITKEDLERSLKYTLESLVKDYKYKLKRVVIRDKGEIVAFLIFTERGNEVIDNIGDGVIYPVLIATAVHPDYRNRGLLRMMIEKSNIKKPYLVHTSPVTPPGLWENFGCSVAKEFKINKIMKCA